MELAEWSTEELAMLLLGISGRNGFEGGGL
jgi:hypothetical protein